MGNRDIHALPDLNVFWNDGGLMQGSIHAVEIVFLLLLLFVVVFGALARKLGTPYPIVLVLGDRVAPTDATAATSIAKRIGLPKRIVDILEGESLINHARDLLALEFGIALLVGGYTPSLSSGLLRLCYLTTVASVVGLVIG